MPRFLPVSNPQNRFASTSIAYDDGEAPGAELEVYEDQSKSILATNDSPDVGFRWSVNPYRGCLHSCAYCLSGETLILMGDGTTKLLRELRPGDVIYGTRADGADRRYVRTRVLAHWETFERAHRVLLRDGTELLASADHRFLTPSGWQHVRGESERPHLTAESRLLGVGALTKTPAVTADYTAGYRADLAVAASSEWARGFLARLFDAEGFYGQGVLSLPKIEPLERMQACLRLFAFDAAVEPDGRIGIRGGVSEHLRFFHLVQPTTARELNLEGIAVESNERLDVASIVDLGFSMPMFDITTGTGDFIANGVVSHNCYARPSHEYLSFGAGTDFERKIVVKPRAADLLRDAFEKKSWKGELIVFSGITDCYQPLESKMRLTRACLEVCAEYRNPVGIITKSPVVERDIDILQELAQVASVRVSVSVPFWDPDVAKAMEPMVTTPERRMKIIETLAKAGIPVGISVSPIVPGLNDDHLGDVLERASEAGARHAFYVLLRLPGAVRDVFEKALREKLPLRAEKVLRRLREAHNGKVYDARFGQRGRGEGVYADTIRLLFERTSKRHGLNDSEMIQSDVPSSFRRPPRGGQTSFGF